MMSAIFPRLPETNSRRFKTVARANGSNMLALVIPCHRVIRADGDLCGYAGGIWRKQRLIEHERKYAGVT